MLTDLQKEQRRQGLGATDCAAAMGLSRYKTPYELWLEKTGRREESAILSDDRLHLRHAHEETISREYARRKNVKLRRVNQTIYHKRLPFMLCNLDRVIIGQKKIVECKSSSGFMRGYWGETGSDEAPIEYLLQVQHQMACTDYDDADIAALIDIDDYRIFETPRNEKVIKRLEDECERFWVEHVLADLPPAPTTRNDIKLMYIERDGTFIQETSDTLYLARQITEKKAIIKSTSEEQDKLEVELLHIIGNSDGVKRDDDVVISYYADKNGKRTLRIKKGI